MKTLCHALVERRDFGDMLTAEGLSRLCLQISGEPEFFPPGSDGQVIALWTQDPRTYLRLPDMLICRDGTESDWAAWITTFAARIRPFSAHMRLMTITEYKIFTRQIPQPELGQLAWPVAGLVLGEVLAASRMSDRGLETLSATACASTLSFVMFRAMALYPEFEQWSHLAEAWEFTRQITRQRPRSLEGKSVARICSFIMRAAGHRSVEKFTHDGDRISDVCRSLLKTPAQAPFGLSNLPFFDEATAKMTGSREERVVTLEKFLSHAQAFSGKLSGGENELVPLALGYLASRIAPGTLRHAGVLGPAVGQYPAALLWYGFCAGLGGAETDHAATPSKQGIDMPPSARRALRDLLRADPILATPVCDIGYLELVALARTGGDVLGGMITTTPGSATIELIPGVLTTANVSSRSLAEIQGGKGRDRAGLVTLGRQIARLVETYKDVVGDESVTEVEQQQLLFPSRRRKK